MQNNQLNSENFQEGNNHDMIHENEFQHKMMEQNKEEQEQLNRRIRFMEKLTSELDIRKFKSLFKVSEGEEQVQDIDEEENEAINIFQ